MLDVSRTESTWLLTAAATASALLVACSSPAPSSGAGSSTSDGGASDGGVGDDATSQDGSTTSLPMAVTQTSSNGTKRFSVAIQIGNSLPLDVFLDTGSSGLRILEGAVPDSAYSSMTGTSVTYAYHSGLVLTGVEAYATVTMGTLTTPKPIPVMLIQQVGCEPTNPNCGAAGKTPQNYTLFGPYKAILGVGMRNPSDAIGNPIVQLPDAPAFIVQSPDYGGSSGSLVIGPSAQQVGAFSTFQLPLVAGGAALQNGTPAYDDRYGLPACVVDQTSGVDYCLPCEWDTGNPPTYIEWPKDTDGGVSVIAAGSKVQVTVGPPPSLGQYAFTVGATPTPGIDEVEIEPATGNGFMNLGTALFFHYDALFDQAYGKVGLSSHP